MVEHDFKISKILGMIDRTLIGLQFGTDVASSFLDILVTWLSFHSASHVEILMLKI